MFLVDFFKENCSNIAVIDYFSHIKMHQDCIKNKPHLTERITSGHRAFTRNSKTNLRNFSLAMVPMHCKQVNQFVLTWGLKHIPFHADCRPYRIVTCRPRLLLQHGDQLEDQEGNIAQAKEHGKYSLDGTGMALRVPKFDECHIPSFTSNSIATCPPCAL